MYVELFLLDNFLMNYLIFKAAEALTGSPARRFILPLGATFGAAYALVATGFFPVLLHPAAKIFIGAVLSLFLCRRLPRDFPAAAAALFGATLLLGGAAYAVALMSGGSVEAGVIYAGDLLRVLLITAVIAVPLPRCIRMWHRRQGRHAQELLLKITHGGKARVLRAMVDTGNSLYDPISGLPVIVVNPRHMPKDAALRPIPCDTIAGSTVLYACRPDRIQARRNEWRDLAALVAASPKELIHADALIGVHVLR